MPDKPETLPLLPLTSGVVLPGMGFTMALETEEAQVALDAAGSVGGRLVLVPCIEGRYASVGVIAEILERGETIGGQPAMVVHGLSRAHLGTGVPGTGKALWVQVEPIADEPPSPRTTELAREYRAVLENILLSRGARQIAERLREVTEPGQIADLAGYSPELSLAQRVQVLETIDITQRLELVLGWARETLADLALRRQIKTSVEEGMEKTQREFLLRRQLDAIRKELGELEGSAETGTPEYYRSRLAERDLPEAVAAAMEREITRLERTSEQSPEQNWIRTWLDTVPEIPWGVVSEDHLDVAAAADVLDADHEGLDDVKERILEHLAVRGLQVKRGLAPVTGRGAGAILALVGPPGVGKTSLGESVARALGRKFVRVALGGVHDEAEIRGHRRTYVGAQPGRLARALREAGTINPVIVLDEVDKVGADYRGDPSSALLEVLDPAQNHTFRDNYLEVELDLSKVLFIATANVTDTVPGPLLDRMEVIRIDGYTEEQKLAIARNHLLARQLERAALRPDEVEISDDALRAISADYTREAGVRNLEREIGRLLRKVATKLASGSAEAPVVVEARDLRGWLGRPRFYFEAADRTSVPGVATGLAVTGT
ncbi:MAG TPA: AAA family ATPase, partial [Acidimicrobiales bacterium]|nr:AAA family ATPase [Acidimicrobiales bacterium]